MKVGTLNDVNDVKILKVVFSVKENGEMETVPFCFHPIRIDYFID